MECVDRQKVLDLMHFNPVNGIIFRRIPMLHLCCGDHYDSIPHSLNSETQIRILKVHEKALAKTTERLQHIRTGHDESARDVIHLEWFSKLSGIALPRAVNSLTVGGAKNDESPGTTNFLIATVVHHPGSESSLGIRIQIFAQAFDAVRIENDIVLSEQDITSGC